MPRWRLKLARTHPRDHWKSPESLCLGLSCHSCSLMNPDLTCHCYQQQRLNWRKMSCNLACYYRLAAIWRNYCWHSDPLANCWPGRRQWRPAWKVAARVRGQAWTDSRDLGWAGGWNLSCRYLHGINCILSIKHQLDTPLHMVSIKHLSTSNFGSIAVVPLLRIFGFRGLM